MNIFLAIWAVLTTLAWLISRHENDLLSDQLQAITPDQDNNRQQVEVETLRQLKADSKDLADLKYWLKYSVGVVPQEGMLLLSAALRLKRECHAVYIQSSNEYSVVRLGCLEEDQEEINQAMLEEQKIRRLCQHGEGA